VTSIASGAETSIATCGEAEASVASEGPATEMGSDTLASGTITRRTLVIQSGWLFAEREVHVWVIETVREWTRLPKEKNGMDRPSDAKFNINPRGRE
jgi:hypothetical protein